MVVSRIIWITRRIYQTSLVICWRQRRCVWTRDNILARIMIFTTRTVRARLLQRISEYEWICSNRAVIELEYMISFSALWKKFGELDPSSYHVQLGWVMVLTRVIGPEIFTRLGTIWEWACPNSCRSACFKYRWWEPISADLMAIQPSLFAIVGCNLEHFIHSRGITTPTMLS